MFFKYKTIIIFGGSSFTTFYAWYTCKLTLLILSSFLVSRMIERTRPTLMLKCPDWFGFDGIEYARQVGAEKKWSTWQCAGAMTIYTLFSSLNDGCNILAAGNIICNHGEGSSASTFSTSKIISRSLKKYHTGDYLGIAQDAQCLWIVALGLATLLPEKIQRDFSEISMVILLTIRVIIFFLNPKL